MVLLRSSYTAVSEVLLAKCHIGSAISHQLRVCESHYALVLRIGYPEVLGAGVRGVKGQTVRCIQRLRADTAGTMRIVCLAQYSTCVLAIAETCT